MRNIATLLVVTMFLCGGILLGQSSNILNHPGVTNPTLDLNAANPFGQITDKDGSKREFRGSLRLSF